MPELERCSRSCMGAGSVAPRWSRSTGARAALDGWLRHRGDAPGPLLFPVLKGGRIVPGRGCPRRPCGRGCRRSPSAPGCSSSPRMTSGAHLSASCSTPAPMSSPSRPSPDTPTCRRQRATTGAASERSAAPPTGCTSPTRPRSSNRPTRHGRTGRRSAPRRAGAHRAALLAPSHGAAMDGEAAHPAGQRLTEPKGERPRAGSASAEAPPVRDPRRVPPGPPTEEAPPTRGGIDVNAACQEAPQKSGPLEEQHRPLPAHRPVADLVVLPPCQEAELVQAVDLLALGGSPARPGWLPPQKTEDDHHDSDAQPANEHSPDDQRDQPRSIQECLCHPDVREYTHGREPFDQKDYGMLVPPLSAFHGSIAARLFPSCC